MKLDHFYRRPPGHAKGRVGCSVCQKRVGLHPSRLEADFDSAIAAAGLQEGMVREYPFASLIGRRWRADRAWPARGVLVELDGGVRMAHGGHTTQRDRDRDNYAALTGWLCLCFEPKHLKHGLVVPLVSAALSLPRVGAFPRTLPPGLRFLTPAQLETLADARSSG